MNRVLLSILVISHNQRDLLKRCVSSLLSQKLNCSYEIVISDDRSTDGTWELIEEYNNQYPNLIFGYKCNSDECDPANVSERCGWNKLNVYNHCRGEFFVNIDADDYLKSDDIYQKQLDTLMAHPECSMCMQDVWQVNDGDSLDKGIRWPSFGKLKDGQILSEKDIITNYRAVNQCYMIRANRNFDLTALYGKNYDDTIITLHHLQFGKCVWMNRADYVWVRYKSSITGTLIGDDSLVEYSLLPIHHILLIPHFAGFFIEDGINELIHLFKVLFERKFKLSLTERSLNALRKTDGYIYEIFSKQKISSVDKVKLSYIRLLLIITKKYKFQRPRWYKYLYRLMTNRKRARMVEFEYWKTNV